MRKHVKATLDRLGVLEIVEPVYFNLRTASPSVIWEEIKPGSRTAPDGFPYPPHHLIYDIIACRWRLVYYESGRSIVDDMAKITEKNGRPLASFQSILDFGCGSGRLLRHVRQRADAHLSGSDYNPNLVRWCQANLPFARFAVNQPEPPLEYDAASFDFIYARSVFTHLPEDLSIRWMKELQRVLSPGGQLYFTMHGSPLASGLPSGLRSQFDQNRMVVTHESVAGENLCSTYATREYVVENLLEGFGLVEFVEGRAENHLRQDIYLVSKA